MKFDTKIKNIKFNNKINTINSFKNESKLRSKVKTNQYDLLIDDTMQTDNGNIQTIDFDNHQTTPIINPKFVNYDVLDGGEKNAYYIDNEIVTLDEIQAEGLDEAIQKNLYYNAYYYHEKLGVEITDELLNIFLLPKNIREDKLKEYLDKYFCDEKHIDAYIEKLEGTGLLFTDEQKASIKAAATNRDSSMVSALTKETSIDRINNYLASIFMEASFRYSATLQAYDEFEKRSITLTGYTVEELYASNDNSKDCNEIRNDIDKRINFLVKDLLLKSSGKLDNYDQYDKITSERFKVMWNGKTIIDVEQDDIGRIMATLDDGNKININDILIDSGSGVWIYIDGEIFDDSVLKKYNPFALANYLYSLSNSDNPEERALFWAFQNSDTTQIESALGWNSTSGDYIYRDLLKVLSTEERKTYNYYFYEEGYEAAEEYLENLVSGKDFKEKMTNYYCLEKLKKKACLKSLDYQKIDSNKLEDLGTSFEQVKLQLLEEQIDINKLLIVRDEYGTTHYCIPKDDNVIYFKTVENGRLVCYEVSPKDDGLSTVDDVSIIFDGFFTGITDYVGGILKCFEKSDGEYEIDESIRNAYLGILFQLYPDAAERYYDAHGKGGEALEKVISCIPAVGTFAAKATTFMSNTGNGKDFMINEGYSEADAWKYGLSEGFKAITIMSIEDKFNDLFADIPDTVSNKTDDFFDGWNYLNKKLAKSDSSLFKFCIGNAVDVLGKLTSKGTKETSKVLASLILETNNELSIQELMNNDLVKKMLEYGITMESVNEHKINLDNSYDIYEEIKAMFGEYIDCFDINDILKIYDLSNSYKYRGVDAQKAIVAINEGYDPELVFEAFNYMYDPFYDPITNLKNYLKMKNSGYVGG